jgi:hypothetical protein
MLNPVFREALENKAVFKADRPHLRRQAIKAGGINSKMHDERLERDTQCALTISTS